MLEQFKALVAKHKFLKHDIDNCHEDAHGNIIYTYNGIMDCAVINDGAEFGDWCDTCAAEIDAWCAASTGGHNIRWFNTLEELVATIAQEVDPDFLPTPA